MKNLEFPIVGTKIASLTQSFNLSDPEGRKRYFEAKAGKEIKALKKFFKNRSFIAYFLGKKNSGKGTYAKLFTEIFGEDNIAHVSVGDLVRRVHRDWADYSKSPKFKKLQELYRGYITFEEAVDALLGRSADKLLPTEFIIALLKVQIADFEGKTIFIDGLPRESDQVSYSLFFRDLVNYRDDPDFFILVDIPENFINERIKYRVVCPICHTSRSRKLLITSKIGYDPQLDDFYLICDNPSCPGARMEPKEGDELGTAPIKDRLRKDDEILRAVLLIHGVPKILLRNHVPVREVKKYFDDYEITPEYSFEWDAKTKKVKVIEKPWAVRDDNGIQSHSLLAPPVVVSMIKQLTSVLGI